MVKINIIGGIDKRGLTYPLIRLLMLSGKLVVVSDDGVYRRFSEDYSCDYDFGKHRFIINPIVNKDFIDSLGLANFDYALFITTNEIIDSNKQILCRLKNNQMCGMDVLDQLEDFKGDNASFHSITFHASKDRSIKGSHIELSKDVIKYILECEEKKEFTTFMNQPICGLIGNIFKDIMNMESDIIVRAIQRKE